MYLHFDNGDGESLHPRKLSDWEWEASFNGGVFRILQDTREYHISFETTSGATIASKSFEHRGFVARGDEEPDVDHYLTQVYDLVLDEAEKVKLLLSMTLNR
jgi:hypothetical protein